MSPLLPPYRDRTIALLAIWAAVSPAALRAAGNSSFSSVDLSTAIAVTSGFFGVVIWQIIRRIRMENERNATRASQDQLQQLMAHANCMLWQADVKRDATGNFNWEWFVPRSELYRRMVGEDAGEKAIMPWGMINVPEFSELEQRSRRPPALFKA